MKKTVSAHTWTWRPYTLWYAGLVGLAGETLAAGHHVFVRMAAAWLVPTLIWVAAHYLGDYLDRELDARSKPQRPIPSGRIRPATALATGVVMVAAACAIGLSVNVLTAFVLAFGVCAVVSYNAWFKARGLSGNLVRGCATGGAFVFGEMMAVPHPVLRLLPFVLLFIAHDAATNLVGALRDIRGDRAGGYETFAVRHGIRAAAWTAMALYGVAIAAALAGYFLVPGAGIPYVALVLLAVLITCGAFRLILVPGDALTSRLALRAHGILVAERLVIASALLTPGLGWAVTLALLIPMLVATLATQHAMRSKHEFLPGDRLADLPLLAVVPPEI